MRIFAFGENIDQVTEFRDVFGMRFVGLADDAGVYQAYRVPNPQAPYPQDYVIDQQGVVRYWSDQFDPREVIRAIDRLIGPGVEEGQAVGGRIESNVSPNPFRARTTISLRARTGEPYRVAVFDAAGRLVRSLETSEPYSRCSVTWDGADGTGRRLPAGVYYVKSRVAPAAPVLLLR